MADSSNNIDIVVADSVDAGIAPKLIAIGKAADDTERSVGSLKAQLADVGIGGLSELSGALSQLTVAVDQNTLSNTLLAEAMGRVSTASGRARGSIGQQAVATNGLVSANVSAAAGLGLLEGRTLSMNRAAANFATRILGLGPILQSAFVAIGAIALIAVIYQAVAAFEKFIAKTKDAARQTSIAFDGIIDPLRKTNDSLAVTNDKLDQTIAKLEHKPTTNGAVLALDQARQEVDKLDDALERVDKDLDKVISKNRVGLIGGLLTGQASTSDVEQKVRSAFDRIDEARQKATEAINNVKPGTSQKDIDSITSTAYQNERNQIKATIDSLNAEYNTRKKLVDDFKNAQSVDQFGIFKVGKSPFDGLDQTANLTALGKSVQIAQQDLRGLDLTMSNIGKNRTVDLLRDKTSALKADTKAAALEWKNLLSDFERYQARIVETTGKKATPQQDLDFLVGRQSTINPLNADKLTAKELPYQNQIASQTFGADEIAKLAQQAQNMKLYGSALKETTELDRIFQEAQKKGLSLDDDTIDLLTITADYITRNKPLQEEKTKLQKQAAEVETQYALALQASNDVMRDHPELADGISRDLNKLKIAHDDLKNPLLEFNRGIQQSRQLLGQYGEQLEVSQEIDKLANELRSQGVTAYKELAEAQRANIAQSVQEREVQAANNEVYEETIGSLKKLTDQKNALNAATALELSDQAKQSALANVNNQINDKQLQTGQNTTAKQPFAGAIADYLKQFTTVAAGIKEVFSGVFKTLADGFADSIGRAIVYSKNLGQALRDVARSAISELISGLIKLALQYLILVAVKKLFGDDQQASTNTKNQIAQQALITAASIASITAIGAAGTAVATALAGAWWPVAEAVSLATFGANAVPASVGIASVVAAGTAASVPKFADGGLVQGSGSGRSDSILARLSAGEFVVNAASAGRNYGLLDSINRGTQPQSSGVQTRTVQIGGQPMTVEVHNYAGVHIETQQINETRMRVIARQEGKQAVQAHSDSAVAAAIGNPNSATSKQIRNVTTASRRRSG